MMTASVFVRSGNIKTFGQALKKIRMERGLSHKEVADRVGVQKAQIRRWETDENTPTNFHLKKLYGTFSTLRFYTHLLPAFERARLIDKAEKIIISKASGELPQDDTWLPPIASRHESLPDELAKTVKPKTFGEHLRALRLAEGLDMDELAELMSVTGQACSAWELDKAVPVMAHYVKLCDLFPGLKNAPVPNCPDKPKPSGGPGIPRNLGNANGTGNAKVSVGIGEDGKSALTKPSLRAVPTSFGDLQQMVLPEPKEEEPEIEEEEIEAPPPVPKNAKEELEFAGVEYANYLAAKSKEEYRIVMLKAELAEAEKALKDANELVKISHDKLIEIATKQ